MTLDRFRKDAFHNYKKSIGLPEDYSYLYGNPVNVIVPIESANNGIMVIGAYPSAKFFTLDGVTNVPLYDINSPFSSEIYFDGSRLRNIPSGKELEVC